MAGIIPLPSTRISGMLVRERLLAQLQADQLDLFRLQNQVSTGQRISLPSEDAPSARRAMTLQRLLERKTQLRSNVESGQSFLKSTDVALNNVASLLGDIRGVALGVSGTTSTQSERTAAASEVDRVIEQLLATANTQFRGRYLFAGSQTNVKPYSYNGQHVQYHGDDQQISSYSDLGVLFGTNAAGLDVFGGISGEMLGGVDLNLQVSTDTPLSSLRNGRGLSANGALRISDGSSSVNVDISRAVTVGDVIRLIEAHPPTGRTITASVNDNGLALKLDAAGGGNLTVAEVGSGKTASELGILEPVGVSTSTLQGDDLDPVLLRTTRLDNMLGTKARARLTSTGANNDLLITAATNGMQYNGATIQLVDDSLLRASGGVVQGSEYAEYDPAARAARTSLRFSGAGNDLQIEAVTPGVSFNDVEVVLQGSTGLGNAASAAYDAVNKRLTITVDDAGATTVDAVVTAIDGTGVFTAQHDPSAEGAGAYLGTAAIDAADIGLVRGDTGNSGGAANTLYVFVTSVSSTAANIRNAINGEGTFTAQLDTLDSSSFSLAGTGVVPIDATAVASGGGGAALDSAGLKVVNGGATHTVDLSSAETVEDLLNLLNGSEAGLHAEINAERTGINVRSRLSGTNFQIGENGGQTATQLGLRSLTGATRLEQLNHGVGVPTKAGVNQTITSAGLAITTRSGATFNVDLSAAANVTDAITAINAATGTSLTAQPGASGGIMLVDNTVGAGGISLSQSGAPMSIAGGVAVHAQAVDFTITARDGQAFNVNLTGAQTLDDVINIINTRTGGAIDARLAVNGNGLELVDDTAGSGNLSVTAGPGSQAAEYLGLVPAGSATNSVAGDVLTGGDRNYLETPSVFTTLVRIKEALQANDIVGMERAIASIDADIDRVTFARSEVGARQQALDITSQNIEEEDVQLRGALSEEIEVDIIEAISNLTARQVSLEASLKATANILQMSLLSFL